MDNLKLSIDLLPRGAWGNNLRERLKKEDWDTLRNLCYERFNHSCAICGKSDTDLDAHEVWDFDEQNKTQALKDIIALCPACHGVKHMRNSIRIGYEEQSKAQFLKVNKCDQMTFAKHYAEATFKFEEQNKVLRWKLVDDLEKFGGKGFELKEREIPLIVNPYEGIELTSTATNNLFEVVRTNLNPNMLEPKVRNTVVDNYEGSITVLADYANKIQWISGDEILKTKYNVVGKFTTKFSVENLVYKELYFKLIGSGGETISQPFRLKKAI